MLVFEIKKDFPFFQLFIKKKKKLSLLYGSTVSQSEKVTICSGSLNLQKGYQYTKIFLCHNNKFKWDLFNKLYHINSIVCNAIMSEFNSLSQNAASYVSLCTLIKELENPLCLLFFLFFGGGKGDMHMRQLKNNSENLTGFGP